jgi:hypothetical protein
VKNFVMDLGGTHDANNCNSGIQVMLPPRENSPKGIFDGGRKR